MLKGEFEVPDEPAAAKDLGNSKWLKNSDDEIESKSKTEAHRCTSALTGNAQSYSWIKKSVHWGDQVCLYAILDISQFQVIFIFSEEHVSLERLYPTSQFYLVYFNKYLIYNSFAQ